MKDNEQLILWTMKGLLRKNSINTNVSYFLKAETFIIQIIRV